MLLSAGWTNKCRGARAPCVKQGKRLPHSVNFSQFKVNCSRMQQPLILFYCSEFLLNRYETLFYCSEILLNRYETLFYCSEPLLYCSEFLYTALNQCLPL